MNTSLPCNFFHRDARLLARDLLGRTIVTMFDGARTSGRIVEVEAYREEDPASHCYRGRTARNDAMYAVGGHLYVYFIYGMHHCVNVVAGEEGYGEAVLLRAIEPIEGIDIMRERRGPHVRDRDLANGPGKLTKALGIGPEQNGLDLCDPSSPVRLLHGTPLADDQVVTTSRIGITKGVELEWRFLEKGR